MRRFSLPRATSRRRCPNGPFMGPFARPFTGPPANPATRRGRTPFGAPLAAACGAAPLLSGCAAGPAQSSAESSASPSRGAQAAEPTELRAPKPRLAYTYAGGVGVLDAATLEPAGDVALRATAALARPATTATSW